MFRSPLFYGKGRDGLDLDIQINKLVRSRMDEICDLEIHQSILESETYQRISAILELEGNTAEELQNKRDSFVVLYSERMADSIKNANDFLAILETTKYLTAVTTVIDHELARLDDKNW